MKYERKMKEDASWNSMQCAFLSLSVCTRHITARSLSIPGDKSLRDHKWGPWGSYTPEDPTFTQNTLKYFACLPSPVKLSYDHQSHPPTFRLFILFSRWPFSLLQLDASLYGPRSSFDWIRFPLNFGCSGINACWTNIFALLFKAGTEVFVCTLHRTISHSGGPEEPACVRRASPFRP